MNQKPFSRTLHRAAALAALLVSALVVSPSPVCAQLEVEKSFDVESVVEPGGVVIWLLHFQNNNPFTITGVVVHDQVPLYTTFDPVLSGSGWVCDPGPEEGGLCEYQQTPVPPTVTRNYRFVTQIDAALPSHVTQLENCFTVTYDTAQSGSGFEACAIAPIDPGLVDMKMEKAVDPASILEPGGVITWQLGYGNQGVAIAERVMVREPVPAHTTFSAAQSTPGWECPDGPAAGNLCVLRVGPFASGEHGAATFVTVIDGSLPQGSNIIRNCATLTWQGGPPEGRPPVCAEVLVDGGAPVDMKLEKTADPSSILEPGGVITWQLGYGNQGGSLAEDVMVRETVPPDTVFSAGLSTPGWECPDGPTAGKLCMLRVGPFASGEHGAATFVTVIDGALPQGSNIIRNCATLTWQGGPPEGRPPVCAAVVVEVEGGGGGEVPLLTAFLDDELTGDNNGNGQANAGELISYSTTVTNVGNATAEAVVFHLDVDPNSVLQIGSVASSQGTVTLGNTEGDHSVQVELGDLGIHVSAVVTWTVAVRVPLPPEVDHLSVQGRLNGGNFENTLTDDPATTQLLDPTVTPLFFGGSGVLGIPTLGELGLLTLVLLLGAAGIVRIPKGAGMAA